MAITGTASMTIAEMREFASFDGFEQRYIRRSLDVGLGRADAFELWARDAAEGASIRAQYIAYQDLKSLRIALPDAARLEGIESFVGTLTRVAAFDLRQEKLASFAAFRFLYERLLGAEFRAWLPAAFVGAAALPHIRPKFRKQLLQSLSEAAATAEGWSPRQPTFYPEYIEEEAA